jgi:hypothetical protein
MADQSGGEGWWIASDGKWYPPELHPDYQAPTAAPVQAPPAVEPSQPADPFPPVQYTDATQHLPLPQQGDSGAYAPPSYPVSQPSYPATPPGSPPPVGPSFDPASAASPAGRSKTPWIIGGGIGVAALLGIGALLFTGSDDDTDVSTVQPTATEAPTEAPTEPPSEAPTEEAPTEAPTEEAPTEAPTEEATAPPTEEPTEEPTATEPTAEPSGDVGSPTAPAAFGEEFQITDEWRSTVLSVVDATEAGLVDEISDQPPADSAYLAITYRSTYLGSDPYIFDPSSVRAVGNATYESFDSSCFLDADVLAAQGAAAFSPEFVPGATLDTTICVSVPTAEIPGLTIEFDNFNRLDGPVIFSASGGQAPDLPAPPDLSGYQAELQGRAVPLGEEVAFGDWSGAALSIAPGDGSGLLSEFVEPAPDRFTYAIITYRATYNGTEETSSDPFFIRALGSAVYGTSNSFGCFLDSEAVTAAGLEDNFGEYAPGDSKDAVVCVAVPTDQLDSVVVAINALGSSETIGLWFGS